MAKRKSIPTSRISKAAKSAAVNAAVDATRVDNSLMGDAIGFPGSLGFPTNQGTNFSTPLSNVTNTFTNLRWYLASNMRQFLNELYVEIGLVQTIVDVPVDDALRGGIEIKSKQLDEEQIEELQISVDRDDDLNTAGRGAKWNRLFGGAGILILTDQDPTTPLELDQLGPDTPLEFRAVDMWELFWDQQNTDGYDPELQIEEFDYYNYYGIQVHKSRVMRLKGLEAPSFIRPRLRGWGFSVVEVLIRPLNQYLKATDLSYEVLDEFKLDVYKIKNLVNTLLSPQGMQKVSERVRMANWQKNYQNAVVMDAEDDFDHKQLSFAGLAEAMQGIRMQVASELRMPLTKIFGISASGFNSGEDDIENYNSMVESQVRNKIKYDILRMLEIKCQKLFGFIPDDLSISFKPLRVMSSEQEENVKTQKFARLLQAKQAGEITTLEFRDACNKGDLFDIMLDTEQDMVNPDDAQIDDVLSGRDAEEEITDVDNPGANRADTRKPRSAEAAVKEMPEMKAAAPKSKTTPKEPKEAKEPKVENGSPAFDAASYRADGGDQTIDSRRQPLFENPKDKGLWSRALKRAEEALGKPNWKFSVWWYKKQGGKF